MDGEREGKEGEEEEEQEEEGRILLGGIQI